jgi:dynein heavy chain, axonemal
MRQFLLYSHVLTPEEIEAHAETGVPENPPTLEEFQNQVSNFEGIYEEITKIEDVQIIDKWLRIDSKPFKV